MANVGEPIIDSLLCYLNSAQNDFSSGTLLDVACAFYSHESIKTSKTTLATLLHKDIVWRRDPEKKKKDLRDVFDFLKEVSETKMKVKFLSDSYKGMPPVGLEFIAPLLSNLSEEMTKINDVLPKILDIKTEVTNTADTVRQLRSDVTEIKTKFSSAVAGIQEAADDIMDDDLGIINDLRSFRESLSNGHLLQDTDGQEVFLGERRENRMSFAGAVGLTPKHIPSDDFRRQNQLTGSTSNKVTDTSTGAITKTNKGVINKHIITNKGMNKDTVHDVDHMSPSGSGTSGISGESSRKRSMQDEEGWRVVNRKRKPRTSHQTSVGQQGFRKRDNYRVLGASKDDRFSLRAVGRTADVFLGRVDKNVEESDIEQYIRDVFDIAVKKIEILKIKTDEYNAFKVTVDLSERDNLFKPDLWPEGMIVNKFYKRGS